jgi:hypothetical protein
MWGNERTALIMNPEGVQQQQNPFLMLNHVVVLFPERVPISTGFHPWLLAFNHVVVVHGTPCSVNAKGDRLKPCLSSLEITICDFQSSNSFCVN